MPNTQPGFSAMWQALTVMLVVMVINVNACSRCTLVMTEDGTQCNCSQVNVSSVSELFPSSTNSSFITAVLDNNQISSVNSQDFSHVTFLQGLAIARNNITHLRPNSFKSLINLQQLLLNNIQLSNISDSAFSGLDSLTLLSITYNNITVLRGNFFRPLTNLTHLFLEGNQIRVISDTVLSGLSNVEELSLASNTIVSLGQHVFVGLSKLLILDLAGNGLRTLHDRALSPMPKLQELYMKDNAITTISDSLLQGLQNLITLDLRDNSISTIQSLAFEQNRNLNTLLLSNNRIDWDSALCSIARRTINAVQIANHTTVQFPVCDINSRSLCYDFPKRPQKLFCECLQGDMFNGSVCVPATPASTCSSLLAACTPTPICSIVGSNYICHCPAGSAVDGELCKREKASVANTLPDSVHLSLNTSNIRVRARHNYQVVISSSSEACASNLISNGLLLITGLLPGTKYTITFKNSYFMPINVTTAGTQTAARITDFTSCAGTQSSLTLPPQTMTSTRTMARTTAKPTIKAAPGTGGSKATPRPTATSQNGLVTRDGASSYVSTPGASSNVSTALQETSPGAPQKENNGYLYPAIGGGTAFVLIVAVAIIIKVKKNSQQKIEWLRRTSTESTATVAGFVSPAGQFGQGGSRRHLTNSTSDISSDPRSDSNIKLTPLPVPPCNGSKESPATFSNYYYSDNWTYRKRNSVGNMASDGYLRAKDPKAQSDTESDTYSSYTVTPEVAWVQTGQEYTSIHKEAPSISRQCSTRSQVEAPRIPTRVGESDNASDYDSIYNSKQHAYGPAADEVELFKGTRVLPPVEPTAKPSLARHFSGSHPGNDYHQQFPQAGNLRSNLQLQVNSGQVEQSFYGNRESTGGTSTVYNVFQPNEFALGQDSQIYSQAR